MNRKFKTPKGVTIENAIRYIAAIEEAVIRDIHKVKPEMRSFAITTITVSMRLTERTLTRLKKEMQVGGDAVPLSDEHARHFYLMLKLTDKDKRS